MAETTILNIDFGDTFERLTQINAATKQLKEENEQLAKSIEEVGDATGDLNKQMLQNEAAIRANAKEKRTLNKLVDDSIKAEKAQKGSIEANRAELSKLTAEYIKLAKPTKEQTDKIKALSDTLKKQEGALGDTRRNVGNYTNSILEAAKSVNIFGINVGQAASSLQTGSKGFVDMAKGADGAGISFKGLGKAIALTGIGLLVIGLTAVIGALAKLEPIANRISGIFNGMSAAFDVVVGATFKFIDGIKNGDGVVKSFSNSFEGLAGSMSDAAQEAYNLVQQLDALEDAQRVQAVANAQAEASVKNLIIQSKDRTLTEAQRLAFLEDAARIEKANYQQQLALAIEQERLAKIAYDRSIKNGVANEELEQKLIDATVARINLTSQSSDILEKIDNRRNALIEEQIKEQEKQNIETRKTISNIEALKKAVDDLAISLKPIENETIDIEVKPTIDVPEIEQAVEEVKSRIANILKDEEDSSLFQALGITGDNIDFALESAGELVTGIDSILQVQNQNRLIEIEDRRLAEIEAVEDSVASEQDKAARITQINERYNNEKLKQEREFQKKQKAIQITQAIINGALAVTNALATVQPFIPLGVAAAALAATTTAIQVGTIAAQKFAQGGELQRLDDGGKVVNIGGRSHAHGGTEISLDGVPVAEAEAGEKMFILKKTASDYINKFGMINQMFGGRSWNGQPVRHAALGGNIASSFDGGFVGREAIRDSNSQDLLNAIRNMPAPVVRVTEINKVQSDVNRSVTVSEL